MITECENNRESVLVEGVHLTPDEVARLMQKHPSIVPFIVFISNKLKHTERMAVRAKYLSLDPNHNKYVKNIGNIRIIQKFNLKRAEEF